MEQEVKNIFNIRISSPFWETLARVYLQKYSQNRLDLAGVLFLLPNRRACQALTAAFIRLQGMQPTILPQMTPIAELDDDEIFFNGFNLSEAFREERPTIGKEERLFIFSRLIMSKPNDFGLKQISLAQALSLAIDLAKLIDTACSQGLSFDKLQDLVPEKYATHWQETLKLLKIITEYWPQILAERKAVDCCDLKNRLLFHQAALWQKEKTQQNVVAAGITACFPSVVALLKSIRKLPHGEIYFAGIDRFADNSYWDAVDETHPLYENKILLELLGINRKSVIDISAPLRPEREKFISEIMRPAPVSDKWRNLPSDFDITRTTSGISFINCNTQRDEALAIALKMREVLNYPEKTAALITYDRNLARRVAAELERFDIKVDDSAGIPLSLSPVGVFLRLIAEAAEDCESETKFITLLKHPFMLCGQDAADFRKKAYAYETAMRQKGKSSMPPVLESFFYQIKISLKNLAETLQNPQTEFGEILEQHIVLAETLASSADNAGKSLLWRGDAGRSAANFITKILTSADTLGKIHGKDYLPLLCELMGMESVRTNYGTHPRLSILGPIEARLCHFDYVILGEANEGIWPKAAQADMWMSRPMKKDFGFSLPEKAVGILGADLCCFLASENVIITRAERVDGVPMKKSRWLLRTETVLKALGSNIEALKADEFYVLANRLDTPASYCPIKAPAPCPPVYARPRRLSASGIDLLIQDPYSVFAKYILKLYPLDDLDKEPDQRDYGTLVHAIIEEFNNIYPGDIPENIQDILLELGKKHFQTMQLSKELEAFWRPKFEKTAEWIAATEKEYRGQVRKVNNETNGEITYQLPGGDFTFTAKADRIDVLKDGSINIIDYKTGKIPSKKQVMSGHALQLPLEGLIASKRGFTGITNNKVQKLIYWQLGSGTLEIQPDEEDILAKSEEYLLKLITTFDFETTPYHSRPTPKFIPKNKDYDHLARIKEWSVQEEGDNNDE